MDDLYLIPAENFGGTFNLALRRRFCPREKVFASQSLVSSGSKIVVGKDLQGGTRPVCFQKRTQVQLPDRKSVV